MHIRQHLGHRLAMTFDDMGQKGNLVIGEFSSREFDVSAITIKERNSSSVQSIKFFGNAVGSNGPINGLIYVHIGGDGVAQSQVWDQCQSGFYFYYRLVDVFQAGIL